MKTEQELKDRLIVIIDELVKNTNPKNYNRRMLLKEYNVIQWVLFE